MPGFLPPFLLLKIPERQIDTTQQKNFKNQKHPTIRKPNTQVNPRPRYRNKNITNRTLRLRPSHRGQAFTGHLPPAPWGDTAPRQHGPQPSPFPARSPAFAPRPRRRVKRRRPRPQVTARRRFRRRAVKGPGRPLGPGWPLGPRPGQSRLRARRARRCGPPPRGVSTDGRGSARRAAPLPKYPRSPPGVGGGDLTPVASGAAVAAGAQPCPRH